ncbi:MAG TPA: hypothetical protein EYG02_05930 [Henriciella marina]|nr:hypothetical protein [Henriciella marina]
MTGADRLTHDEVSALRHLAERGWAAIKAERDPIRPYAPLPLEPREMHAMIGAMTKVNSALAEVAQRAEGTEPPIRFTRSGLLPLDRAQGADPRPARDLSPCRRSSGAVLSLRQTLSSNH